MTKADPAPGADRDHQVASRLVGRILDACQVLDARAVRASLDEADGLLGLAGCVDDVLMPAMRQVGLRWAHGQLDIPHERMTTEAVRSWLEYRKAFAPPPLTVKPILLASGPRDLHTIGLESLALLLRFAAWPARVLGARTSTSNLLTAARATNAAGVVVVSHFPAGWTYAVSSLKSVDDAGAARVLRGQHVCQPDQSRARAGPVPGNPDEGRMRPDHRDPLGRPAGRPGAGHLRDRARSASPSTDRADRGRQGRPVNPSPGFPGASVPKPSLQPAGPVPQSSAISCGRTE